MGDNKVILNDGIGQSATFKIRFSNLFSCAFIEAKDMSLLPKVKVVVDAGKERGGLVWRKPLQFRPVILS